MLMPCRELRTPLPENLDAAGASDLGLVTFTPDDIDWEDEVRIVFEERASFSPDALTGLEANLRFAGPETMETKIFGRLNRMAELDLPTTECGGGKRCPQSVRKRSARRFR